MKKEYFTPFIQSRDLSNFHFARTQATCDSSIINNETLQTSSLIGGGCGNVSGNLVQFCLSGDNGVLLSDQAVGLFVNTLGGSSFEITACGPSAFPCQAGDQSITCAINGNVVLTDCVVSLACPDGTILTTCGTPNCLVITDGIPQS